MEFQNQKILMFSTAFFGYEYKIKKQLEMMGAKVSLYDERSITSAFSKALLKFIPFIFRYKTYRYYKRIAISNKPDNFNVIFFNECTMVGVRELKLLHTFFPDSRYILYLDDSVETIGRKVLKLFPYFDKVLTYDRADFEEYSTIFKQFYFRPLYYSEDYSATKRGSPNSSYLYDVAFIGTIHSDRYKIIQKVTELSIRDNFNFFSYNYFQSWFVFYFYKFLKIEFKKVTCKDFQYNKMSSQEISKIFNNSKAILDMQYPTNCGLTMRTIETLGMKRKLITTNKDILTYDFYNENNILIIDRDNLQDLVIPASFLKSDYMDVSDKILERYSLNGWIREVFS